jgi:putative oxidoreductase
MNVGLFLIHLSVGGLVAAHGTQKLFGWFGGRGLDGTARMMDSLGLKPARPMARASGAAELVGGLMLVLGFLTPVGAAIVAGNMLVAARTAHAGKGAWNANGGWEYVLMIAAVAIGLAVNGAGTWSLDNAIGWNAFGLWWGIASLAFALLGGGLILEATAPRRTARSASSKPVAGTNS